MDGVTWLMYANIAVWIILGGYLAFLGHIQKKQEQRLKQLSEDFQENKSGAGDE